MAAIASVFTIRYVANLLIRTAKPMDTAAAIIINRGNFTLRPS